LAPPHFHEMRRGEYIASHSRHSQPAMAATYDDRGMEDVLWHEFTQGRGLSLRNGDQSLLVTWEAHPAMAKTFCAQDMPCVTHYASSALPELRGRVRDFVPRAQTVYVTWMPAGEDARCIVSTREGDTWSSFTER
jgi:hypothetical protein